MRRRLGHSAQKVIRCWWRVGDFRTQQDILLSFSRTQMAGVPLRSSPAKERTGQTHHAPVHCQGPAAALIKR